MSKFSNLQHTTVVSIKLKSTKMSNNKSELELVFIPAPGMGHLLSTVQLAKRILSINTTISISIHIINLPIHTAKINAYIDSNSRDNTYPTRLTFISLPPLSNPPNPTSPTFFATTIELHKPLVKQVVEDRTRSGFPKPAGFILGMFCATMVDVGNELNVPSYIFCPSGTSFLNLVYHTQSLADDEGIDVATKYSDPEFSMVVPGFKNPVTSKVVPGVLQDKELGVGLLIEIARKLRETKGVLINTYEELESYGVQALLEIATNYKTMPTIYPVGPILELDNKSRDSESESGGGSYHDEEKDSIIKWLDDQPERSVVFLCFGSMGTFDEDQVKEIANGLDQSGLRFLWALRKPPQQGAPPGGGYEIFTEALPEGFLDRTDGRGKVIGWAPQVEVLDHSAVGGFVTHCGWNSTLESIWFGVPMATFPVYAEQQLNAFALVKELGLAVEIRMDYKKDWKTNIPNFLVKAHEIEYGIKKLMNIDEKMRKRVKEMSDIGRKALEKGGSSYTWLTKFIDDVSTNVA